MSEPTSKIIVDDDWKSQVENEKQGATNPVVSLTENEAETMTPGLPPKATFETLATMLFTQGMASLGQLPSQDNQAMPINKDLAKHFIDTIELLGEKTKGNLSNDESSLLGEVLHVLRLTFVSVRAPK